MLREELDRVREQGYAVAVDELEVGLAAAAAPIRNAHGDIVASMSVSGPTFRMPEATLADVIEPADGGRRSRSRTGSAGVSARRAFSRPGP